MIDRFRADDVLHAAGVLIRGVGIDASQGAVFFAAGVFYYFKTEDVRRLFAAIGSYFPGAVLTFDSCNERGAKLMRKTWLKEAGITDVSAFFSLEDEAELE